MAWAFAFLNLGCVARVFLPGVWPLYSLWLAAACWAGAFALFAWHYAPMLLSARTDGHPG